MPPASAMVSTLDGGHRREHRGRTITELVSSEATTRKGEPMPKYLALFSYSHDAMAAMIENPADRETAVRGVLENVGGRLESMYWMFGAHDGIAIVDAPDSLTMAGVSAAVSSTGSISSETHELFSTDDVHHILETARQARAHFAAPGQGA
jgi:uncharacterized protein with GYD domain